jgi:hypothetical protein
MAIREGTSASISRAISRRQFLVRGAVTAGAASLVGRTSLADALPHAPVPEDPPPDIVQVRSDAVLSPRGMHDGVLLDMLHVLLERLTRKSVADAWRSIIRADDVVALKFNGSGADGLGTSEVMLRTLVTSLSEAGFDPDRMVAIEVSPAIRAETRTQAPDHGWSTVETDFGSGRDQLAAWLEQVTAIINVPFLKTHNIAGVTGCLKNLSHAVIKHPAQFHDNGCSPYIGDIVALPAVRSKLRLHLVNALRVVFDKGPRATEECIWDAGMLLGGFDPVALDTVGLTIVDRVRETLRLPRISASGGPPAYLAAAARTGLGTDRLHQIRVHKVKL